MKNIKKNRFKIYYIILAVIIFIIALLRAIKSSITFDEAITYMNFVDINNLSKINYTIIANNHILNTILMFIMTKITGLEYNEFVIRIPNLIFYLIYIIYAYRISKLYKNKYTVATLLLLNYSINEFSSLARGYGISAALILVGIYYYKVYLKDNNEKDLIKTFIFTLLASLANTINLIIFGVILIDSVIRMIQNKKLKKFIHNNRIKIIIFLLLIILLTCYHFFVSFKDHNLAFCTSPDNFKCLIQVPLNYYGINFINKYLLILICIAAIILLIIKRKSIKLEDDNIFYMCIMMMAILIIIKIISPFNLPTGRTLIPFLSIYIISFIDYMNLFNYQKTKYIYLILILLCFFSFFKTVNINYVREWKADSNIKKLALKTYKNKDKMTIDELKWNQLSSFLFYYKKYKKIDSYDLITYESYREFLISLEYNQG